MLRIAVQAKGRLYDETMSFLEESDIKLSAGKRTLLVQSANFPLEVLFLRDDDIPQSVATGIADIGIVGENEFVEKGEDAEIVKRLGFSKCRLSLAVPKDIEYKGVEWFDGKKIATSYPGILDSYLKEKGVKAEIHVITGSVEVSPGIGLADAIFDIVSSGSTLVSNSLKEVEVVMRSEALLIGNKHLSEEKKDILRELLFRMDAVKTAEDKKYVLMNAPKEKLEQIISVLPGMKSPTVMPLAQEGWCSVHTVLDEKCFWEIIGKLKSLGAEGILVLPIEKMILQIQTRLEIQKDMIQIDYPERSLWPDIMKRPVMNTEHLFDTVRAILRRVKSEGDRAVLEYEEQFDKVALASLAVTEDEMQEAGQAVSEELKAAILLAKQDIEAFHAAQRFEGKRVETQPGVTCWQKAVPIERVGLYIPGGTAPLFSTVLMLAVPARIAGCREIVLCTPPGRDGKVHPAVLFAARVAGVSRIFKAGGVQAIGAMAYGTESVPRVYKIFGPGNQYVTAAKQLVSLHDVAIDMPAGPSEVEVLADETANPVFVAADLLSQAEHGVDSQAMLVTTSEALRREVVKEVERQLALLPRKEIAARSLENSKLVCVADMQEAIELTNAYAPEHLIIQTADYARVGEQICHAGSVFLGPYSCESAGDYASGTNHTLPTNGYARAYSGVCLDSFIRKMTFQEITSEGLQRIGPAIEVMAAGEQLEAHRNAVAVRLGRGSSKH